MDVYRIVYTEHARARMAERDISKEEVAHTLSLGVSIQKNKEAGRFPKEEVSCQVGSCFIHVVVGINHASKIKIVVTAYAKGKKE
ncbi:MAG TPA: DUF4258 domain-containing protein [Ktedonobacteraceae bacterium]